MDPAGDGIGISSLAARMILLYFSFHGTIVSNFVAGAFLKFSPVPVSGEPPGGSPLHPILARVMPNGQPCLTASRLPGSDHQKFNDI